MFNKLPAQGIWRKLQKLYHTELLKSSLKEKVSKKKKKKQLNSQRKKDLLFIEGTKLRMAADFFFFLDKTMCWDSGQVCKALKQKEEAPNLEFYTRWKCTSVTKAK